MMRTSRLPTIHVSVATTTCQYCGGGPQVNKIEKVSSDDHQVAPQIFCLMEREPYHVT